MDTFNDRTNFLWISLSFLLYMTKYRGFRVEINWYKISCIKFGEIRIEMTHKR